MAYHFDRETGVGAHRPEGATKPAKAKAKAKAGAAPAAKPAAKTKGK